jgi:hypothetical protein
VSDLNKQARGAIEAVARTSSGEGKGAKIRLRFDKVANRVISCLQATAVEAVPDGMTVVLTITAPIRLASKTTLSLEDLIRTLIARKRPRRDYQATIHGNRIRIRIFRNESERGPKLLGFVHNSDSDSVVILDTIQEMLALPGTSRFPSGGR